jgi:hypothetical protein
MPDRREITEFLNSAVATVMKGGLMEQAHSSAKARSAIAKFYPDAIGVKRQTLPNASSLAIRSLLNV